ncbi:MAG: TIGR03936 family radical SAM-associated protein [Eubacteriales bacterium]|nr:TIGR03936 family radical SAM-associated protein [Eubacteriales bacterium]
MKMRCVYSIDKSLRHVGHLDIMRTIQRALRRSELPVCYSEGFNPHILLSVAAPLSVNMAGEREIMDIPLSESVLPETFLNKLNESLPLGIRAIEAHTKDDKAKTGMSQLLACSVRYEFLEDAKALIAAIPAFLEQKSIPAIKKSKKGEKEYDLRPLIYNLSEEGNGIKALLALSEAGTAKPDAVINALTSFAGLEETPYYIPVRTGLFADKFVPLELA